jgi:hypothetical protein
LSEISVLIEAEIHPTEDIEKVRRAIGNLFANLSFEVQPLGDKSLLRARTSGRDGLVPFQRFLREARIRDAARRLLMKGRKDRHIVFCLHRQAAYVGHVSFCEPQGESPLGPLVVMITTEDPTGLIDWIAPSAAMREGMGEVSRSSKFTGSVR